MLSRAIKLSACATVAIFATSQAAMASHAGATADCGAAGTFTVKAATNSAGFQSPTPFTAIVFEENAVLTAQQVSRNGVLLFTRAGMGAQQNNLSEVTCSFTTVSDGTFTVTGVLAGA
jgi:hypothetical protein